MAGQSGEDRRSRSSRVQIFDTTLRDGEQAPGFSMNAAAKLRVAHQLGALKVDVIEAGFAAASPGDAKAIAEIAKSVEGPIICSLARAKRADIEAAGNALVSAPRRRIHVFIATSPIHRAVKLRMDRTEILGGIASAVAEARRFTSDVEFSAEDAIRTEPDFLAECLSVAAREGASTLNVPDTVGYAIPEEIFGLFKFLDRNVDRPSKTILSTHCHNDLGLALANSLAAIRGGARQVECTINGIGERAGNCALEEVVMALRTRQAHFELSTGIDCRRLVAASEELAAATGIAPPPNKAVVGTNAFAHEAGIHQHGVLQDRTTYEIMRPEDVGRVGSGIVLGKHSGKAAFARRTAELGFSLDEIALGEAFDGFKRVADRIGLVDDARLCALLRRRRSSTPVPSLEAAER